MTKAFGGGGFLPKQATTSKATKTEASVADKDETPMANGSRGIYALVQPHLEGRKVAELWPDGGAEGETLRQLGAAEVSIESPVVRPLPFADGALDIVLCNQFPPEGLADDDRDAWLTEIARVLSPDGFCVLRVPSAVTWEDGDAGEEPHDEGEPSSDSDADGGSELRAELEVAWGGGNELATETDIAWHADAGAETEGWSSPDEFEAVVTHVTPEGDLGAGDGDAGEDEAEDELAAHRLRDAGGVAGWQGQQDESSDDDGGAPGHDPAIARRHAWRDYLRDTFAAVDLVEEVGFTGVSFRVPGTEDLAIAGDLSPLGAPAQFEIVIAAKSAAGLPLLTESLVVPLREEVVDRDAWLDTEEAFASDYDDPELPADDARDVAAEEAAARIAAHAAEDAARTQARADEEIKAVSAREEIARLQELAEQVRQEAERVLRDAERERDEARLAAAGVKDRETAREATIASLRESAERQWHRIAEAEATAARLGAERDEAMRRAQTAEESLRALETNLRRREWEVSGLERDLERFPRPDAPKG